MKNFFHRQNRQNRVVTIAKLCVALRSAAVTSRGFKIISQPKRKRAALDERMLGGVPILNAI